MVPTRRRPSAHSIKCPTVDSGHIPATSHRYVGRGGLLLRSRHLSRMVPESKPNSTEDPSCIGSPAGVGLERESQLRCRLRHLTAVQKYVIRPKIVLVVLKNSC
ncbi:hypothetical protein AVEN_132814-1 [Araneus ventricosus]|uniref:Uncharacterized protein n=1 Tax=Araneus ventricosus TaxID=182803 RepID=A0A4Y2LKW2_ARAVE|nr:hypothetical protein AVEN_132814-1 [Araneus ventricosus]